MKRLSDFFEKTGTYVNMSSTQQHRVHAVNSAPHNQVNKKKVNGKQESNKSK